ncbi:hypothetical protein QF010_006730, partial [Pseudomonas silensiensis]
FSVFSLLGLSAPAPPPPPPGAPPPPPPPAGRGAAPPPPRPPHSCYKKSLFARHKNARAVAGIFTDRRAYFDVSTE